jgi:outer membrane protein OmpA-like peptidoglycan-associated protein
MKAITLFLFLLARAFSFSQDSTFVRNFVLFYEGSNCAIDSNYKYRMNDLVDYLKQEERSRLHIRGHVCCGPDKSLSKKRARKVYRYLVKNGVAKNRLSFEGCSNSIPLRFPEKSDEDEAMNRRVDFVLTFDVK